MKENHLEHRLVAIVIIGFAAAFFSPSFGWRSYAGEKHGTHEKGHEHDEHGEGETHGKEEGHEEPSKGEQHDEEASHGHADGEDDEHGHGHGDHEEEEGGARFGPGKAITAANKKEGIQLSEKASKTLGLTYVEVTGSGTFKVPLKSVVFSQDEVGVYRFKDGWHKIIDVEFVSKTASEAVIKTSKLNSGDKLAKDGVPLLRAAELEAWGGSGDGHGH